ncbi:MAG: hypothetical protein NTU51_05990 [Bacteroidetes bacterium]|nr:hypothetical protein [Bacteroidota bacterium]
MIHGCIPDPHREGRYFFILGPQGDACGFILMAVVYEPQSAMEPLKGA